MRCKRRFFDAVFVLLVLTIGIFHPLQAQHFRSNVFDELSEDKSEGKSNIADFETLLNQAEISKDTSLMVRSLVSLSSITRLNLDFEDAFDFSGRAVYLAEEFGDDLLLAKANEEFGVLHFMFKQYDTAESHYLKSLTHAKRLVESSVYDSTELFQLYYYLAVLHRKPHNFAKGSLYLDTCLNLESQGNVKPLDEIYLNWLEADYLVLENLYQESENLLQRSKVIIDGLKNDKLAFKKHQPFLIAINNSLANIYLNTGDTAKALSAFEEALDQQYFGNELILFRSFVHIRYAKVLNNLGRYKEAYFHNEEGRRIADVYLNPRKNAAKGFLLIKNSYRNEIDEREQELAAKNLELAEQKQKVLQTRILLYSLIFVMIVFIIVIFGRMQLIKIRKKQQLSAELLDHKNKELTANMLQLIEKEEIIKGLIKHLSESNPGSKSRSYIASIEKQSVSLWEEFNTRFVEQNGDFYERLQKKVPNLTPSELKLCALLKLNFSAKEMAYLLGMTMNSIHVARHRLRKKMNLERDTNLTGFVGGI